jgi:hypothetical protein
LVGKRKALPYQPPQSPQSATVIPSEVEEPQSSILLPLSARRHSERSRGTSKSPISITTSAISPRRDMFKSQKAHRKFSIFNLQNVVQSPKSVVQSAKMVVRQFFLK